MLTLLLRVPCRARAMPTFLLFLFVLLLLFVYCEFQAKKGRECFRAMVRCTHLGSPQSRAYTYTSLGRYKLTSGVVSSPRIKEYLESYLGYASIWYRCMRNTNISDDMRCARIRLQGYVLGFLLVVLCVIGSCVLLLLDETSINGYLVRSHPTHGATRSAARA